MDPFDRERARPHGGLGVGALASLPLEAGLGLDAVELLVAELPRAGLVVHRPVLRGGVRPPVPSLALPHVPALAARAGRAAGGAPAVAFEHDGSTLRAQIEFPSGTSFYGAGLAAGPLLRNGRAQTFWNTDAFRYGEESPALYSSHPCALAVLPDGGATFVAADSIRKGGVAFASDGVEFAFEGEPFDVLAISAADPGAALAAYTTLAGRMQLPPRWALGYHQCRWSYASQAEVLALAREFRRRAIPCDAIWLDIDHMQGLRAFTWDAASFPDPAAMLRELHAAGFRCVAIVDPGLAADEGYEPGARARAGGHLVLDASGRAPVAGRVWPGVCRFPDFTRASTRRFWGELCAGFAAVGLDGLWCDMNEPAVFRTPTRTLPEDARHRGLGGGSHRRFHNLYGHLMARATREGLERARPKARSFVLTRASHLATARWAATWTGDNQATWQDLRWAVPMVLALGLSGQPFSGPDLGGFDGDPDPELFARWFELGAWLPFARGHGEKSSCRKEPWSFGPGIEALVRAALARRMRLLPFLYTLFEESARTGLPVARPLFFADPRDQGLRSVDDQFLLGDALCIAPALERGVRERRVRLPRNAGGGWYAFDFEGSEGAAGDALLAAAEVTARAEPGRTPVFARAGSIVALGPARQHAGEAVAEPLHLHVFLDARGAAEGALYEDDGEARPPRDVRRTRWRATWRDGALALDTAIEGRPPARAPVVVVHGAPRG